MERIERPKRALVTGGMPYANGPLHVGHLAGALVPPDVHARWLGLLIGRDNVLFVCGTDDHGSTSELAALKAERPIREFIDEVHERQERTLERYAIGLDVYSGTSRPDCLPVQTELARGFIEKLNANGMLIKRSSEQWYDTTLNRFLADRFVRGECPNPKCDNPDAYGDECDRCGHQHEPRGLLNPRSAVSGTKPELRETVHLYLDMWKVAEVMRQWVESKKRTWRPNVVAQVMENLMPSLRLESDQEQRYKALKKQLPSHKQVYARDKQLVLKFENRADFETAASLLQENGIESEPVTDWAYRSITRDTSWGVPVPALDPDLEGKTLYVWPDSLIAPIGFTMLALTKRGEDPARYERFWNDPESGIYQFLGQDNVFFYVLMQGAMWLGTQDDPMRLPKPGELQLSDVFGSFHLSMEGEKMSKSRGNFYTGEQLLDEKGYDPEQIRYYLAILGLAEKPSDFEFQKLDERNAFLAGPLNAALERPISAAHSKFASRVPEGKLLPKVEKETLRIVQRYTRAMQRADYPALIFELERYARIVNGLFAEYKPHDDRYPEASRADALYSSFYIVKNLMIMLYPFVPRTMDRVRESLRLPPEVLCIDELGTGLPAGHEVGEKQQYFPAVPEVARQES